MPIFGEKPFTSITVKVNQLCTPNRNSDLEDEAMELYLDDLISLIKLQSSGGIEAARALRKKVKYGNTPAESVLALNLLELLVLNAGSKIGQTIASDDKLYDLLKGVVGGSGRSGLGGPYDASVVKRARELAYGWKHELNDLSGYSNLASLYKAVPRAKGHSHSRQASAHRTQNFDERPGFDEEEGRAPSRSESRDDLLSGKKSPPPPRPVTMSPYAMKSYLNHDDKPKKSEKKRSKSKKRGGIRYADEQYKIPQINYKVEAPKIRTTISDCHTHTTALDNRLLALTKGNNPMDDPKAAAEFEKCRKIRRKVLRYLQYVGAGESAQKSSEVLALDEEFLGSLIVANDQLVTSFKRFDELCGFTAENPAQYHQDDQNDEESASSDESYYSSESEDEETNGLAAGIDDLKVHEASSRLEAITSSGPSRDVDFGSQSSVLEQKKVPSRPPQVTRQDTAASTGSGDPFGDRNEVSGGNSLYY